MPLIDNLNEKKINMKCILYLISYLLYYKIYDSSIIIINTIKRISIPLYNINHS